MEEMDLSPSKTSKASKIPEIGSYNLDLSPSKTCPKKSICSDPNLQIFKLWHSNMHWRHALTWSMYICTKASCLTAMNHDAIWDLKEVQKSGYRHDISFHAHLSSKQQEFLIMFEFPKASEPLWIPSQSALNTSEGRSQSKK